jgi:hypothetical protein
MQIYDGKCGPLTETVSLLLEPYEGKGYHLYQDNYYNSVHLAEELLQKSIRVCGTIRVNHGFPKDMIEDAKKLKKGEVTFRRKQDVLLVTHQDKRLVNMISTLHTEAVVDDSSRLTGVTKKKPKCVADYNTHMLGVDTADQYLAYYSFIRKTVNWPKKVFFYFFQCALFNWYLVFTKSNPNSHKSLLDYLVDVSENLMHTRDVSTPLSSSDESQDSSRTSTSTPPKRAPKSDPPGRLDGELKNHKLVHIPPTKKDKTPTRRCRVCIRKNIKKETRFVARIAVFLSIQKAATHNIIH